jgi:sugar/nucleoside kinase (ribokinase family)
VGGGGHRHQPGHPGGAPTGAAFIFLEEGTGQNAIIVGSGAAALLSAADLDRAEAVFSGADVFLTQLEQPVEQPYAAWSSRAAMACAPS